MDQNVKLEEIERRKSVIEINGHFFYGVKIWKNL